MTRWCPRCDALRDAAETCPTCGTPLADVTRGRPRPAVAAPPPAEALPPAPPGPTARVGAAMAVAVLVLAGVAFLTGRAGGREDPATAAATRQSTSTTAPAGPQTGRRSLQWSATHAGVRLTAVAVERFGEDGEGVLTVRVTGLPRGQEVLALAGLTLRDAGGGLFASPRDDQVGRTRGVVVRPGPDGTYLAELGPTPALDTLTRVEVEELVVGKTSGAKVDLDTSGPWPEGAKRRAVQPGKQRRVQVVARGATPVRLDLEVMAGFVGGGRADVVVAIRPRPEQGPERLMLVTAQLRAGGRVLCARTRLVEGVQPVPALVVGCETAQVDRLTVELGAGSSTVPVKAVLHAS